MPATNNDKGQNKEYIFGRTTMASARLSYQHSLLQARTGYLLHPKIACAFELDMPSPMTAQRPLEILDLATGNGIWLTEVAYSLSQANPNREIKYTGLDIASSSFPPRASWPRNASYATFDLLADDVPAAYVARFDIIHVRLIVAVLWQDPSRRTTALANMKRMLKPGGWLQWHDGAAPTMATYDVDASGACTWHTELHPTLAVLDKTMKFQSNAMWINQLDEFVMQSGGMEAVEAHWIPMRLDRAKYENDLAVWSLDDAKVGLQDLARAQGGSDFAEEAIRTIEEVTGRIACGEIPVGTRTVVVIGRKAS